MRPLDGIKVIEVCTVAAGPYCAMLLADMGADVIKIEHPQGGDTMRQWPPISDGFSDNFASVNRNKRSVALDLKNPKDNERARQLMLGADVVLENNRPGVMARLGLDFAGLSAANPRLIYCSISAYGQEGPRAKEAGFDLTLQAVSGIMSVTGEPEGAPVKCGVPVSDFATGLYGAFAVASALREVAATGKGMHIDASMFGASLAIAALQTSEYFGTGVNPRRLGSAHPRNAPYQAFRAKDGYFAMAAGNDSLWRAACKTIDREDLIEQERFKSPTLRAKNQEALREIWEGELARGTCAEWLHRFREAGVACAPINSYGEALADPQVTHMGWIESMAVPGGRDVQTFGSPLRFNGNGFPIYRSPPALGEHNDEIFGTADQTEAAE
jgi:crotonobetainyl-CoA:carnitine CoA-transferase CaiB-like acyl-CoA transferase